MNRIVIAILLSCVAMVHGVDYTSTQDGTWSAAATWGGGGVPGNGDRAVINHAVTLSGTVTVGESPVSFTGLGTTDPAIDIILGASLTLADDAVLNSRGDIKMLGVITMGAGSVLELDASQAAAPASTVYRLCVETSWDHRDETWIQVNGTAVKRCAIRSNAAGDYGQILADYDAFPATGGQNGGGRIIADYCDFSNFGDADNNGWVVSVSVDNVVFRLSDCTFDNCSLLYMPYASASNAATIIENCIWSNSIPKFNAGFGQSYILQIRSGTGASLQVSGNYFDEKVLIFNKTDAIIQDNVFNKAFSFHEAVHTTFQRNFVRWQTNGQFSCPYGAPLTDNIFIMDFSSWNPHYINISGNTGETVLSGNIFAFTTPEPSAEGDGFMIGNPASGTRADNNIIIENTIVLPNGNGPSAANNLTCTLFTILFADPEKRVTARRNTVFTNGIGGCNVGETQIAYAGNVDYAKSNLFVGDINTAGYKIRDLGNSQTDVVLAAAADYNASYRCADGSNYVGNAGKGYHLLDFSGSADIGQNDLDDVDPQFVDWTRTAATWDASLGGPGTLDSAALRLAPGGGSTMQNLLDYIREGFRPTNEALRGAGDPGAGSPDIGAVDMAVGSSISISIPVTAAEGDGVLIGQGTVTLSTPASGNQVIDLSSDDVSEIMVGAQVTVLDTQTTATFDLTVIGDGLVDGTQTVTITGSAAGWASGQDTIQVTDIDTPGTGYSWDGDAQVDLSSFLSPITTDVKTVLRAIMLSAAAQTRTVGRLGQIGDSITNSSAYHRSPITWWDEPFNETGHDYLPVRQWMTGLADPQNSNWYVSYGKGDIYGCQSGWELDDAITFTHPTYCVETGDGSEPGNFSWCVIMFGSNESWAENFGDPVGWKANYKTFIQGFIDLGVIPVISTIPPLRGHLTTVDAVNVRVREISDEMDIPLIDFHAAVMYYQPAAWDGTLIDGADGVHLSNAGGGVERWTIANITSDNGNALRTKLTWDMGEKIKAIVYEDGTVESGSGPGPGPGPGTDGGSKGGCLPCGTSGLFFVLLTISGLLWWRCA